MIAALYDIHGNLPALEAVLADLLADPPDDVVIGGDVAAGPQPVEVLAALRALPWRTHWLRGNVDRLLLEIIDDRLPADMADHPMILSDRWTAARMPREDVVWLASRPRTLQLDGVLFCHATPASDDERVTVFTPDERLARIIDDLPFVVAGHTHRQFDRRVGGARFVNAGSVGRPNESRPGAYWAQIGDDVTLRRTEYDTAAATTTFAALGYPIADTMLAPVDADAVARRFEEAADRPVSPASRAP